MDCCYGFVDIGGESAAWIGEKQKHSGVGALQVDSGWLERVLLAGWLFDSVDETTSHTLPCNFDFRFDFDS